MLRIRPFSFLLETTIRAGANECQFQGAIMTATQQAINRDGLAKIGDACRFLSVSRSTLYSLMDKGVLPYAKIGGSRRIPWRALETLVHESTRGPRA
jgi:excisionase family DNA binding protein